MANTSTTVENPRDAIQRVGTAGIVIAIPTYNNAETIGGVVKAATAGVSELFGRRAILVQADGGSTDATMQRALDAIGSDPPLVQIGYPIYPVHRLGPTDRGVLGRDSAYRTIFSFVQEAGASACCILEPDTMAVTPQCIASLLQPILETNYDFIAPFAQRHKTEGLLVNGLLYPLVRALFGKRVRQPVGSIFGFSTALIRNCLSFDSWQSETVHREVDLWICIQAISNDMKVAQVRLAARSRPKKDGASDLSSTLANVVGALYSNMEETAEIWQRIRGSQPVPTLGLRFDAEAEASPVDVTRMIDSFRLGYENLREIWAMVLPPASLLELKKLSRESTVDFLLSDELWTRIVYDFAIGHRLEPVSRDHLLRALTPLYIGWAASFILSVKDLRAGQVEERIERLALMYETQKPYLISRWRSPDRFMP